MKLKEVFDSFILSKKLADLSEKTISDYIMFVYPFIKYVGVDSDVLKLTQDDINKYIGTVINKPLSKSTKATYIRHIKVFLKWLQGSYNVIYDYKLIKVPKSPKKQVKIYTVDEIKTILDTISAENDWLTLRNKCIIALMYDSGLRQSEVCTLLRNKVSYSEKRMTVYGKGNKERIVPIGNLVQYYMQNYLSLCPYVSKFVFVNRYGEPLTCNAVKLLVSKISNKLPFELSSHKLRHNFATNYCLDQYENRGQVDIYRLMILLGHEDVETTRRYLHIANEIIGSKDCISHLDLINGREN